MEEAFLHFIWRYGRFSHTQLKTCAGDTLEISSRGIYNTDSGPDFSAAVLSIGGMIWAGNVEIHVRSSDWIRHRHQYDAAYDSVVLHVVWEHDTEIFNRDGKPIPTLELKDIALPLSVERYRNLKATLSPIPCAAHNPAGLVVQASAAFHRSLADRLIQRGQRIGGIAEGNQNDWQSVFYQMVSRYLGFRINSQAMEELARITPQTLIAKNRDSLFQTEALLFGQSGLLQGNQTDAYARELAGEYRFLAKRSGLTPMEAAAWKFMRMRPHNFPTMKIAQLAAIVHHSNHLFSKVLECRKAAEIRNLFRLPASGYWSTHYRFGPESPAKSTELGQTALDGLIINAVAPVLFAYGRHIQKDELTDRAFDLLSELQPEDNKITRQWTALGFRNQTAYESQAILGLQELYCNQKRCTECPIGMRIISG